MTADQLIEDLMHSSCSPCRVLLDCYSIGYKWHDGMSMLALRLHKERESNTKEDESQLRSYIRRLHSIYSWDVVGTVRSMDYELMDWFIDMLDWEPTFLPEMNRAIRSIDITKGFMIWEPWIQEWICRKYYVFNGIPTTVLNDYRLSQLILVSKDTRLRQQAHRSWGLI